MKSEINFTADEINSQITINKYSARVFVDDVKFDVAVCDREYVQSDVIAVNNGLP